MKRSLQISYTRLLVTFVTGALASKASPRHEEARMESLKSVSVASIRVYPVKGCAGIELQQAHVTPTGFAFDRHWMVVTEETGKFLSQRKLPRMALIQPALPDEALDAEPGTPLAPGLFMTLSAPGQQPLKVALDSAQKPVLDDAGTRQCSVWEWSGPALDAGDEAAAWLSAFLGAKLRLVRYAGQSGGQGASEDEWRRATDAEWAPSNETAFADGFPFLLVGQASLDLVNSDMEEELPMNRFRPSIVVSGTRPFEEDTWQRFSIGEVDFESVKPCDRCKVPTVNQETAAVGKEPLEALHRLRNGLKLGWSEGPDLKSWKHAVFFGVNLVAKQPKGLITQGQAIQVQELRGSGEGSPPWQKLSV